MAEVRGDEWLPQGWKVEVRVRKSGKRDRYYRDPVSGYVFRSLKDIDRYLLTGKLGRRAMKSKPKDVAGGSDPVLVADESPVKAQAVDASKEKDPNPSNGSKKGVQKQNSARSGKRKPASGGARSNQKPKNRKKSKSPRGEESDDFFILDSDQGADITDELGLPNLPEMIDSARKCDATYLSAPEIAVLLGRQMPGAPPIATAPKLSEAREDAILPFWTHLPTYPEAISQSQENSSIPLKTNSELDSPVTFPWGDMFSDPCIEFAIKTLTGAIPLGSASNDSLGAQQPVNPLEARKDKMPHENDS